MPDVSVMPMRLASRCFRVRSPLLLVGLIVLGSFFAPAASAQRAFAYVGADSVTVGQRFSVAVVATRNSDRAALFLEDVAADSLTAEGHLLWGDLEILRRTHAASRPYATSVLDSVVYEVTTFALDTAFVPPIPVAFVAGTDTSMAQTQAFIIPVISTVPPDAQGLRDLAPLATFPRTLWPYLLGVLLLGILGVLLYRYVQRRRAAKPVAEAPLIDPTIPPYEEAIQRLRRLEQAPLEQPDAIKPFYVELSGALRRYLGRRLGVGAMEETTYELVRDLKRYRGGRTLPPTAVEGIQSILELSDFVKFADTRPDALQSRWALQETYATLARVEESHRPAPETPAAPPETSAAPSSAS